MTATEQQRRFTHTIGYGRSVAESDDERMEREARHGESVARRLVQESQRQPESRPRLAETELPPDFVAEVIATLEIHVGIGNWGQAVRTIKAAAKRWRLRQESLLSARNAIHSAQLAKLAWHVSSLLDHRAVNEIERHCNGTVGSLLEVFPQAFVNRPGVGPHMVERIAKALTRIGVIDAEDAGRRLAEWKEAMSRTIRTDRFPDDWR